MMELFIVMVYRRLRARDFNIIMQYFTDNIFLDISHENMIIYFKSVI